MKHLLLTTIAAVLVVGCGLSLSEFKDSQLRSAIKEGSIEDVKKAIANGANVNAMAFRSYGALVRAPLHEAAWRGRKDIVQLLIAKGANVNTKTDEGSTPLHSAAAKEHENIAELLIAKGADVHAKSNGGTTPLHAAANGRRRPRYRPGQPDHGISGEQIADLLIIVETLIAKGADVNAKNDGGETPLDWAIEKNHTETADLLRKHGGKTGEELKAAGK